jgi:carboxymethylenebutenolidase
VLKSEIGYMQTINNQILLSVADGTAMNAFTAAPVNEGVFPGIILLHEAFGITSHIKNIANRIAAEGYTVVAPELFHRTAPGVAFDQNNLPPVMPYVTALKLEELQDDLRATYGWLQGQPPVIKEKIGSIGFCMGGRVSFIANFTLPLSAAVSYYGSGIQNFAEKFKNLSASHLFFWGGMDKHILPEHVDAVTAAMKANGKAYANVVFSYADHAFNNNERHAYNAEASAEAWALTLAFFKNKLK